MAPKKVVVQPVETQVASAEEVVTPVEPVIEIQEEETLDINILADEEPELDFGEDSDEEL